MSQAPNQPDPTVGAPASVSQALPPHAQPGNLASTPGADPLATSPQTPTQEEPLSQGPPTPPLGSSQEQQELGPELPSSPIEYFHYPEPVVYVGQDGVENLALMCSTQSGADSEAGAVLWVFDPILGLTCYRDVPHQQARQDEGHYWRDTD